MILMDGKLQMQFKTRTAIPTSTKQHGHPPQRKTKAKKRKQPPQRHAKQTFGIGCQSNPYVTNATNFAFCLYHYTTAIVPNRPILPVLIIKRVNIYGMIAVKRKEFSEEEALCLTPQFHVDALRAQHEYGPLGTRLRRGKLTQISKE
ncbi:MAG: hypothetical protein IPK50_08500 [Fibrobacterota bacterium]|nr:MAG: hypothetical protein IPK50_08500 [Fibrobacterota bacterium]